MYTHRKMKKLMSAALLSALLCASAAVSVAAYEEETPANEVAGTTETKGQEEQKDEDENTDIQELPADSQEESIGIVELEKTLDNWEEQLEQESKVSITPLAEEIPSEGELSVTQNADFGARTYAWIEANASKNENFGHIKVLNETGERISNVTCTGLNEDSKHFYLTCPKYFEDSSGDFVEQDISVQILNTMATRPKPRPEPYEALFEIKGTTASGKEVSTTATVTLTVLEEGESTVLLDRIGLTNGTVFCTLRDSSNGEIDYSSISASDFQVSAVNLDGESVELEFTNFEIRESDEQILIHFTPIPTKDTSDTYTFTVSYKNSTQTGKLEVNANEVSSNVPADGRVLITVLENDGQTPIAGAKVTLTGMTPYEGISDSSGKVEISNVEQGIYGLVVEKEGYEKVSLSEPKMQNPLTVQMTRTEDGDLGENEKGQVNVQIVDQDGQPVAGADVKFYCAANNNRGTKTTDGNGKTSFQFTKNSYEIVVSASGHFTSDSKVIYVNQKEQDVEIVLYRRNMCSVMTTVRDEDGNPIQGAQVQFTCPIDIDVGKATTNSQGKTSGWISIRENDYVLTVQKAGYETYEKKVRVTEDNSEFTVTLYRQEAVSDDDDSSDSSSSSSSGSSNSSSSGSSGTVQESRPANNPVKSSEINQAVVKGIQQATQSGKMAVAEVVVKNATSISADALKAMASTAAANGGKATLMADSLSADGKIEGRIYLDSSKVSNVRGDIKLGISTSQEKTAETTNLFQKFFDNEMAVVQMDHQGALGMHAELAVKVDISKLNADNLMFYVYNKNTNKYSPVVGSDYYMDKNGFLHFKTSIAGDIVITDKPLTKK